MFERRLCTTLTVSASSLQGDASNSPLTRQATTVSGVLGVACSF